MVLDIVIPIVFALWCFFTSWAWHIDSIEINGGWTAKRIFRVCCPIYHIYFIWKTKKK